MAGGTRENTLVPLTLAAREVDCPIAPGNICHSSRVEDFSKAGWGAVTSKSISPGGN